MEEELQSEQKATTEDMGGVKQERKQTEIKSPAGTLIHHKGGTVRQKMRMREVLWSAKGQVKLSVAPFGCIISEHCAKGWRTGSSEAIDNANYRKSYH